MTEKNWAPCPRCKSNRVKESHDNAVALIAGFFALGGWLYIGGVLPMIMSLLLVTLGALLMLVGLFGAVATTGKTELRCEDCTNVFYMADGKVVKDDR